MLRRNPKPIAEHEARGDTARIYHELRQTLRVSGVNLNFRAWAGFPTFFPLMWSAMQPIVATQRFEAAADDLRARAADLSGDLPVPDARHVLGESQRFQIQQALALYHYINPKLLLFTALVRRGLAGEASSLDSSGADLGPDVPFGPPSRMAAMEMVDEEPADRRLRRVFADIRKTMRLSSINSDYRTLGLWPDYLQPAWKALKRVVRTKEYGRATESLAQEAETAARRLPVPLALNLQRLEALGENADAVMDVTMRFEQLLPPLVLNIALLATPWCSADELRRSPFPVGSAPSRLKDAGAR